jgi:hypothetical protein
MEPPGIMTAQQRAERFQAGLPWDGRGVGALDENAVNSFTRYPLYWLGTDFGGYNLQAVNDLRYDAPANIPNARAQDSISMAYGTCTPAPGTGRCLAPITIHIQPICLVRPEIIAPEAKASPNLENLRGAALIQHFTDGHVRVWTGTVTIYLSARANPGLITAALARLEGTGLNRAITPSSTLPAPDFSAC